MSQEDINMKNKDINDNIDHFATAREVSQSYFQINSSEELFKHVELLKNFTANELVEINNFARKYGPKLEKMKKLARFVESRKHTKVFQISDDQKMEIGVITGNVIGSAILKSQEQISIEALFQQQQSVRAKRTASDSGSHDYTNKKKKIKKN